MKMKLVTKLGTLSFVVLTNAALARSANAINLPGWERPILTAKMEAEMVGYQQIEVRNVELTLNRRDGAKQPTSITLSYINQNARAHQIRETMKIESIEDIGCGSIRYTAQSSDTLTEARSFITLEDHSNRICRDLLPGIWMANYRSGYGFCGTMDLVMELIGNPQPIYTIANE